jgi:hypothetical protein
VSDLSARDIHIPHNNCRVRDGKCWAVPGFLEAVASGETGAYRTTREASRRAAERSAEMVFELRAETNVRRSIARVAHQLNFAAETRGNWADKSEVDSAQQPGPRLNGCVSPERNRRVLTRDTR